MRRAASAAFRMVRRSGPARSGQLHEHRVSLDQLVFAIRKPPISPVEKRVEVEAVGQMDPQPGGGRMMRPEREQRLGEGHEPKDSTASTISAHSSGPGAGAPAGAGPQNASAASWKVK
jgi:hypothetical protein